MGMNLVQAPEDLGLARFTFGFHDDFEFYVDTQRWTKVTPDSGTVTAGTTTAVGGLLTLDPGAGATTDDETYIHTTASLCLIADGKPMIAEASVKWTEADTNKAAVAFGFASGVAADFIQDGCVALAASFSGAGICKFKGDLVYSCFSSIGAVQTVTKTAIPSSNGAFHRLRVEIRPLTDTLAEVTFWYDASGPQPGMPFTAVPPVSPVSNGGLQQFLDPTQTKASPIKHIITYTGAAAMQGMLGVKNGSGVKQTLISDYFDLWAKR
jgi:hypothetical protein